MAALVLPGCTSLREIPRDQIAVKPERKDVRVVTRAGLQYEFDFARFEGDTLVGYRRRDVEGPIPDYATLRIALDDVARVSSREVDWTRTAIIGGGVAAVGIAAGLASRLGKGGGAAGGGDTGRVP